MRKKKFLSLLLAFSLLAACASCGKQEIPTDFGDDYITDDVSLNDGLGYAFSNPMLYYQPRYGDFIYCLDFETGESYPLCSKPNCFHNSEDCNAYSPGSLCLYEDRIIAVNISFASGGINSTIWSLQMDGSGGDILGSFIDKAEFKTTGTSGGYSIGSRSPLAYRGYIYCGFDLCKEGKQILRLYRLPASGGSSEIVWEEEFPMDPTNNGANMFLTYFGLGNKVYFVYHHGPEASSLCSYDIETGEVSLLRESQPRFEIIYFAYGKWYYMTIYGVYCWNPETGEERCLVSLPTNPYENGRALRFYERGFYLPEEDDPDTLAFYDWDGNVTHLIKIDALPSVSRYLLGHLDNYILFQYGNKSMGYTIAVLDTDHLDDPSPEWMLFEFPTE